MVRTTQNDDDLFEAAHGKNIAEQFTQYAGIYNNSTYPTEDYTEDYTGDKTIGPYDSDDDLEETPAPPKNEDPPEILKNPKYPPATQQELEEFDVEPLPGFNN